MLITRPPHPSLRPFVTTMWASDQRNARQRSFGAREHLLPTGNMHLVFRLGDAPLHLFDSADDRRGKSIGHRIVGGARSTYYIRDISTPSCSVGVMLRPGAAELLFGASAEELSERHTSLDDLWGWSAGRVHEQLLEAPDPARRLAILESVLSRRLPVVSGLHPAIACAMERFERLDSIDAVVKDIGYSHRHFIALFRRATGLTPKVYYRVRRFQKALRSAEGEENAPWASIALEAGYSDQAHFSRDFLAFAGVTPSAYRRIAPRFPSHVTVATPGDPSGPGQISSRHAARNA